MPGQSQQAQPAQAAQPSQQPQQAAQPAQQPQQAQGGGQLSEQHLIAAGVPQQALQAATRMGFGFTDVLALLAKYGSVALEIIQEIAQKSSGGGAVANP